MVSTGIKIGVRARAGMVITRQNVTNFSCRTRQLPGASRCGVSLPSCPSFLCDLGSRRHATGWSAKRHTEECRVDCTDHTSKPSRRLETRDLASCKSKASQHEAKGVITTSALAISRRAYVLRVRGRGFDSRPVHCWQQFVELARRLSDL
jgi:hypothetical protein